MSQCGNMQMGETAASYKAKFVVGLGDNFYLSGITSLDDPQIKEKFEVWTPKFTTLS